MLLPLQSVHYYYHYYYFDFDFDFFFLGGGVTRSSSLLL